MYLEATDIFAQNNKIVSENVSFPGFPIYYAQNISQCDWEKVKVGV